MRLLICLLLISFTGRTVSEEASVEEDLTAEQQNVLENVIEGIKQDSSDIVKVEERINFVVKFFIKGQHLEAIGVLTHLEFTGFKDFQLQSSKFIDKKLKIGTLFDAITVKGKAEFSIFGSKLDLGHFTAKSDNIESTIELVIKEKSINRKISLTKYHVSEQFATELELPDKFTPFSTFIANAIKMQLEDEIVKLIRGEVSNFIDDINLKSYSTELLKLFN